MAINLEGLQLNSGNWIVSRLTEDAMSRGPYAPGKVIRTPAEPSAPESPWRRAGIEASQRADERNASRFVAPQPEPPRIESMQTQAIEPTTKPQQPRTEGRPEQLTLFDDLSAEVNTPKVEPEHTAVAKSSAALSQMVRDIQEQPANEVIPTGDGRFVDGNGELIEDRDVTPPAGTVLFKSRPEGDQAPIMPTVEIPPSLSTVDKEAPSNYVPLPTRQPDSEEWQEFELLAEQDAILDNTRGFSAAEVVENIKEPKSNEQKRMDRTIPQIQESIKFGYFALSGDHTALDEKGHARVVHSSDVTSEMARTLAEFGRDPYSDGEAQRALFAGFKSYRSMDVDRSGKIFNSDKDDLVISDTEFVKYLREIRFNARQQGDPFYYSNPDYEFAGTKRYPNLMTNEMIDLFVGVQNESNILNGVTQSELRERNLANWYQRVQPALKSRSVDEGQRKAVLDIRDAIMLMTKGLNSAEAKSRYDDSWSLAGRLDPETYAPGTVLAETLGEYQKEVSERRIRARRRLDRERQFGRKRINRTFSEANKNIDDAAVDIATSGEPMLIDRFMQTLAGWGVVSGTALRLPLIITAPLEATQGLGIRQADMFVTRFFQDREKLRPATKQILDYAKMPEVVSEVMGGVNILDSNGDGMDVISSKIANGESLVQPGMLQKHEDRKSIESKSQRVAQAVNDIAQGSMDITTAEYAWRSQRTRLWLKRTIMNLQKTNLDAGLNISQQWIAEGLRNDTQKTLHILMDTQAGREALLYVSNTTMGGMDPVVNFMMLMGSRYPRAEFLVRAATSWFWRYGWRATMRLIPLSGTAMYLTKTIGTDNIRRGIFKHDEADIQDSRQYLYGGNEEFLNGLAMNVQLDMIHLGGTAFAATLVSAIAIGLAGGAEPPDDPALDHLWYEWQVGGKAIKESWYSNDLFGVGMPAAITWYAAKDKGLDVAGKILLNGMADKVYSGAPLGNIADIFDMFNNFNRNFVEAQMRSEGNLDAGKLEMDNFFWTQLRGWAIRRGISTFEPAVIRDFYNDFGFLQAGAPAKSKNVIWNDDTYDENDPDTLDDVKQVSYSEAELRRTLYNSPMAGMFMNILTGAGFDDDKNSKTGYMRYQMPDIVRIDETQKSLADLLNVFDENGEKVPVDQWTDKNKAQIVNQTLDIIASGDPTWLAQQGYVIPYDARVSASLYLDERKQLLWALVYRKKEIKNYFSNDYYENDRMLREEFDKVRKEVGRLDELKANLWSDQLPYSPTKYGRWETSYRSRYFFKESGEETNPLTMFWMTVTGRGDQVGMELYASGDHKSPLLPFGTVQNPWNSYNAQTPAAWQGDLTDYDMIEERDKDVVIAQGANAGENLWDLETGGEGRSMQAGQGWDPTLVFPERGHFAKDEPFIKKPSAEEFQALAKKLGYAINSDTNSGASKANLSGLNVDLQAEIAELDGEENNSSSWRRYGGGSGGGGYTPNIYSRPAYSLNSDRPQGVYTQTPYRINFDYLRPSVETKGSREAWRREEI